MSVPRAAQHGVRHRNPMPPVFDQAFWANFWPSVISSLAVSFILAVVITWLLSQYKKPNLEIAVDIGHGGGGKRFLVIVLRNIGRQGLMPQEAQWFIYFEHYFMPEGPFRGVILNNQPFWELRGFNETPVHPGSSIELISMPVKITKDFPHDWLADATFYCSITTNRGSWKPSVKLFGKSVKRIRFHDGHINRDLYKIKNVTQ